MDELIIKDGMSEPLAFFDLWVDQDITVVTFGKFDLDLLWAISIQMVIFSSIIIAFLSWRLQLPNINGCGANIVM